MEIKTKNGIFAEKKKIFKPNWYCDANSEKENKSKKLVAVLWKNALQPKHILITFVLFSEVNDCNQTAVAKPIVYCDRPRVCMNLRVANIESLDDEIETEKQVYIFLSAR